MSLDSLTNEEAILKLEQDYGWEVTGPSYSSVPNVKKEYVEEIGVDKIDYLLTLLTDTYFIKDSFDKDHLKGRRPFRRKLQKEDEPLYRWIEKKSRLRTAKFTAVLYTLENVIDEYGPCSDEIKNKIGEVNLTKMYELVKEYLDQGFEEKVKITQEFDKILYGVLERLSK